MKLRLTDKGIQALPKQTAQYEAWDEVRSGLGVRVSPGGRKSFTLVYRFKGQSRRMTLGAFPEMTLAAAREQARTIKIELAKGDDPQRKKRAERLEYASRLYSVTAGQYIELYAKRETRSWKETKRILFREEIAGAWRRHTVKCITRTDVSEVLDAVRAKGPSAAAHALADLRRFFNWCQERDYIDANPCAGLKPPRKLRQRTRVLSHDELRRVWIAADKMRDPFRSFIHVLILTLQRRSEVAGMRGSDLDFQADVWTQTDNKSDREHRVFLGPEAKALLAARVTTPSAFLFKARGSDSPISGFSKWKGQLDILSGVKNWRLHDLRRTATTRMSELGVPIHVCELVINHRARELDGIVSVYNRNRFEPEQRSALVAWGEFVAELVAERPLGRAVELPA